MLAKGRPVHTPVAERYQIELPSDQEFGPAMSELNERQRKFVVAYIQDGGKNVSRAVEAAGYSEGNGSRVQGWVLLHNPKIQAAIKEEAVLTLDKGAILSINALVEIVSNPKHKDRYKAAADILDRRGFLRVTGQHIEIEDKRTEKELVEFITATARRHGLDPRLLLGSDAIDAKFKDVTNVVQAPATPEDQDERGGSDAEADAADAVEAEGGTSGSD